MVEVSRDTHCDKTIDVGKTTGNTIVVGEMENVNSGQ